MMPQLSYRKSLQFCSLIRFFIVYVFYNINYS